MTAPRPEKRSHGLGWGTDGLLGAPGWPATIHSGFPRAPIGGIIEHCPPSPAAAILMPAKRLG